MKIEVTLPPLSTIDSLIIPIISIKNRFEVVVISFSGMGTVALIDSILSALRIAEPVLIDWCFF